MSYKSLLLLSLAFMSGLSMLNAQSVSESRTLEQSFAANKEISLDISNKYGKVHLSPSRDDSVRIRIELIAFASKSSKLKKLIDGVSFNLISTNNFIIAETRISKGPVNFLENIRSLTNNLISSETKLNIDYYISAPEYMKTKIENRYGDIYIESSKADIEVVASNGNIKTEDLLGKTSFDLNFYNATLSSLRSSDIRISYGEINIERADELKVYSTSSRIEIGESETIITESKRDKYYIGKVSTLEGNSYFTDFDIDILKEKINLESRYGNLIVKQVSNLFEVLSLESSYTDIYLRTQQDASFGFDAKLNNCYASIPDSWNLDEKVLNRERNEYLYSGTIGASPQKSQIILKLTRGELDIMQLFE